MLIQFSITNYKTFREKATLSLLASNYDKNREEENIIHQSKFDLKLLKSAVLYGANASGKTKIIDALFFMREMVVESAKDSQKGENINVEPFLLNTSTEFEPTEFEVIFIHNNIIFRYGFEVTNKVVIAEWLYMKPETKEIELFYRDLQDFEFHARQFKKGKILQKEKLVRDNALLLSVAAQFNDEKAGIVLDWFDSLKFLDGLSNKGVKSFTMGKSLESDFKKKVLNFLVAADLGITDFKVETADVDSLPDDFPSELKDHIIKDIKENNAKLFTDVLTFHPKFDGNLLPIGITEFSIKENESSGTEKYFSLAGPIIDVLEKGSIFMVDELDSKLHPNLVCKLVGMFNSKEMNPNNAQLIFNTHDTNLLKHGNFRRDQIWFTEKNRYGEAVLYPLSDFKSQDVRATEDFEEKYINGKYGAIPYLGNFNSLMHSLLPLKNLSDNEK